MRSPVQRRALSGALTIGMLAISAMIVSPQAVASVSRVVVESRETPAYAGQSFGTAGQYVRLTGHFFGELDPQDPLNAIINDILLAPLNSRGRVEYSATFTLLRPLDSAKASGVLWYEVPNRGNSPLNPRPSADAVAAGHILLSSGWQGDLAPRAGAETISVPVARNADGSSLTGPVLYRVSNARGSTASLTAGYGGLHYQFPATLIRAIRRKLAIDELKALASYPPKFQLTGSYGERWARIGNSVPPLFMKAIALNLRRSFLT